MPAHKVILVINSDYFKAMFADGFHELHSQEITVPPESGLDFASVKSILDFMYTGQMTGKLIMI